MKTSLPSLAALTLVVFTLTACALDDVRCYYDVTSANGDVKDSTSMVVGQVSVRLTQITGHNFEENQFEVDFMKPPSGVSPIFSAVQVATLRNAGSLVMSIIFEPVQGTPAPFRSAFKIPGPTTGELPALRSILSGNNATLDILTTNGQPPVTTSLVPGLYRKTSTAACPIV